MRLPAFRRCSGIWKQNDRSGTSLVGVLFCTPAFPGHTLLSEVMPMPSLTYQPLSAVQCLDVLRSAHVTRAAFTDGTRPYIVPMAFQLEAEGTTPLIYLCMPDKGRKVDCLAHWQPLRGYSAATMSAFPSCCRRQRWTKQRKS